MLNTTGRKIWFPNGLETKYCSALLDVGEMCNQGVKCYFVHAVSPNNFTDNGKMIIQKHLDNPEGLYCKKYDNKVSY